MLKTVLLSAVVLPHTVHINSTPQHVLLVGRQSLHTFQRPRLLLFPFRRMRRMMKIEMMIPIICNIENIKMPTALQQKH